MNDDYFTVAEIAELLKVNRQTIRNWIDRGELRAVRVGQRRVRIRQSDLEAFIESSSRASTANGRARTGWADFRTAADSVGAGLDDAARRALINGFSVEPERAIREFVKALEPRRQGGETDSK